MALEIEFLIDRLPRNSEYRRIGIDRKKEIIVHHMGDDVTDAEIAARYHTKSKDQGGRGWPGIGYHIFIDFDGTVQVCNYLDAVSYHCGGNNTPTIGIGCRGNWEHELPPLVMRESLKEVIKMIWLMKGFEVPVKGHQAYRPTSCPGKKLQGFIDYEYGLVAELTQDKRGYGFGDFWENFIHFHNDNSLEFDDDFDE